MLIDILIRINIFGGENQAAVSNRVIPLTELRPSSNKHKSGFAVKCQELNEKKTANIEDMAKHTKIESCERLSQ